MNNVVFFGEIDSTEILAQCHVGLVALHLDRKTHNIPGRFVYCVQYGVPVLARVNPNTDLQRLIEDEQVDKSLCWQFCQRIEALGRTTCG